MRHTAGGRQATTRGARILLAVLIAFTGTTVVVLRAPLADAAVAANAGAESSFVASINAIRQAHGIAPLQVDDGLVGVARGWTDHMASAGAISHNPSLTGSVSAPWRKLGENVGVGYDVNGLMTAFVNSPAHYENIVDPEFNYIGVGVTSGADGRMYTTHDFMKLEAAADPSAAPAPPPPPRQPHRAPPTTAPPAPEPPAAPAPPPPPPPPPADPVRVHAILTALRAMSG